MWSKKLHERKIIIIKFINFIFFCKPKDENKSNIEIIQHLSGMLFVPWKINLLLIELKFT